jgi:hypothetical protein
MKMHRLGTEKCIQNSHRICLREMITSFRRMKVDNIKIGHTELKCIDGRAGCMYL